MSNEASVKLAVTVTKNPGRKSGYTAAYGQYPYGIEVRGETAAEAKANLTAALAVAVSTIVNVRPAFARDDDGAVWAAVPAFDGGSNWYRVTSDTAWGGTSSSAPTAEAFGACVGFTAIPNR